jgi:phage terminase Nu1 subunit (DNA packaging protein)
MRKVLPLTLFACGAGEPGNRAVKEKFFQGVSLRKIGRKGVNAMPESEGSRTPVNAQKADVIAKLFGVSVRRVQQLTQEGIINTIRVGNANRYDLLPTIQKYIKYLQDKANGREAKKDDGSESRKLKAEVDLKESKAKMAELELKELEGKMHRSEDVEAMTVDLVYTIRSMIMALPGRLAVDVANAKTAPEASELIKKECHNILNELANYRYDPEAYKRRVRDRQGWRELEDDDSTD